MTKDEVVKAVVKRTGKPYDDAAATIEAFMSVVKNNVAEGKTIYLRGFGKFFPRYTAPRKARNVKKNLQIDVLASVLPKFAASDEFKAKLKKKGGGYA